MEYAVQLAGLHGKQTATDNRVVNKADRGNVTDNQI
jgi:hypothetical protein